LQDSQVSLIIGHPIFADRLGELTKATQLPLMIKDDAAFLQTVKPTSPQCTFVLDNSVDFHAGALIIYTSGTTGKPKGAVSTHFTINAQTSVLVKAWYWTHEDRIHHILPLHHIHGVVNALLCPLYCGATVEMHAKFDAAQVWMRWSEATLPRLTVFMSVPTVYAKLTQYYNKQEDEVKSALTKGCKQFRFMVSGSASLPTSLRNDWRKLSGGQVLLERYGMTGRIKACKKKDNCIN
jgi:malonyl-CoA/methylmalonyl-CoA synthetase